jgi:hypothetical protein
MRNPVRSIIIAGALYDLLVALPLAIPPLARPDLELLFGIGDIVGLTGTVPQFDQVYLLFINLFGVFVSAWGFFKLRSGNLRLVSLDLVMRLAVLALLVWHVIAYNSHPIVYMFIAADILWTALDYWGHRRVALD